MPMLAHDLTVLEFDKVRGLLAHHTSFSAGHARALDLVPSAEADEVERRQQLTAEAALLRELRPNDGLGGARDVTPLARRASLGAVLLPSELLEVQATAHVAARWQATLDKLARQLPTLAELRFGLSDHSDLEAAIAAAIDDGGEVLDAASSELRRLRAELRAAQERLMARLRELITSSGQRQCLQEPIITQRNGRYVVPVKAEYKTQFKGLVHDQSASGATLFMEPLALVELGNRCRQLELAAQHEVERILQALSAAVGQQAEALARSVDTLGELDLLLAQARLAEAMAATRPEIVPFDRRRPGEPVVRLVDARHPLLGGHVVPISLELGADYDVVLITGPNTGGKTVALKTVGLLALMAQAGLQLPAAPGSRLAVFESIRADVGDEQSIEQSLSTFSSHITRVVDMLRHAGPRSLVLLDELGAGTDPLEGAALARAIVEYLLARGTYCVATTHYSELKAFAAASPRVENASVEFDLETLAPTYRLSVGLPGRSNALAIAAHLGMPAEVLGAAQRLVNPEHGELEGLLAEVRREREVAVAERARAAALAEEQDRLRRRLREALAETERQRREAWRRAREESEALLSALRREARRLRERLAAEQVTRQQVEEVVREVEQLQPLPAPPEPVSVELPEAAEPAGPLAVGVEVLVPSLGVVGTVLALGSSHVELEVSGRRVRLPLERLAAATLANRAQRRAEAGAPERLLAATFERAAPLQLDLRGKRRDEAAYELDAYLHDAYMAGLRSVRVVHGRGTGAVRQAVQELLATHPLVEDFAFAEAREGGDGATVVRLSS
ncbi:MAG: endonuclease MutS2 [Chloroflexi bacterium]|nr:endonuclease MutS2 [Chloroflexota bacterium]